MPKLTVIPRYPQQAESLITSHMLRDMQTRLALARQALRNIQLLSTPEPLDLDTAQRLLRRIHQLTGESTEAP
jgi:hypothetical protein